MSWQKRFTNILFSIGLGAGLLIAQICNVACIAANCTQEKQVTAPTSQSSNHCHNTDSIPQEPERQDDSHQCQNHDLTVLLAASELPVDLTGQLNWQAVELVPDCFHLVFSPQPKERIHITSLRSPPPLPRRLNLRI